MFIMVCNKSVSLKKICIEQYYYSCYVIVIFFKLQNRFIPYNISTMTFTHNYLMQKISSKRNMNVNVINDTCTIYYM